ncbi:MAG: cytochrome bd ubiquinol oxidase subunit [Cyanobacteria bacterium RYN_339]|nr:cytochrome bd ubiquinol oxidase subunit [Cyanobacteria bacterium RYN_339]
MDLVMLSRIQFALTIMFHYLFPPLTIGLGFLIVALEGLFLKTKQPLYESAARFWTRLFAVNFAMGVATGIVMEFQFGTNWATYSRFVGDVFGSALASEGVFAFFLESGFLAVLVFGWDRVGPRMHFFATLMVALGGMFSAVWIVVANSWMQTPAGFHVVNGRAEITDFWAMVFNPSSMIRLAHTLNGAMILGAFFMLSISAYYVLRGRHLEVAKRSFLVALVFATVFSWGALVSGDGHANQVARTQPAKLAAFEGHFKTGVADLHLLGVPDEAHETVRYAVVIPGGLSFLVHRDFTKPVDGLDKTPPRDRPPVAIPFYSFHLMVALGMSFIGLTTLGLFFWWRGTLFAQHWLMGLFVVAVLGPYAANQAGWATAEVGRQPWIVYGLLRTSDGVSKVVAANAVLASILMFGFIYLLLFFVWVYVMNDKIQHGPDPLPAGPGGEGFLEAAGRSRDECSLTDTHQEGG